MQGKRSDLFHLRRKEEHFRFTQLQTNVTGKNLMFNFCVVVLRGLNIVPNLCLYKIITQLSLV